jgi:hypothetical protein
MWQFSLIFFSYLLLAALHLVVFVFENEKWYVSLFWDHSVSLGVERILLS